MRYLVTIFFTLSILAGLHPFGTSLLAQNNVPKLGACGPGGVGGGKNPLPLNGSHSLGMTYNNSACGLNYVEAHEIVETRYNPYALPANMGTGLPVTLPISGLPSCCTILKAYLWYNVSYQSASPPATTVNITNPAAAASSVPATNIGTDGDKCWSETGTVNYRADVTAAISGNGNYVVNITGLTNPNWEVDGVEFIIIYKDNGATYQGSFVIWDGAITNQGSAATQTMTGINACAAGVNAKAFMVISDMQDNTNGNQHPATLNGVTANYPNNFWCVDQTNTTVTSGQATATFGTDGLFADCYDWSIMGLYYQTTTCTTCVPAAISLTVTPTPSTCGAPNGSATAAASGAPTPYTYTWSTGATSTSISNLTAGSYSVNVVDATGCSTTKTFTITSSIGPSVTFVTDDAKCFGGSTGSATLTATGGQAPYTYAWATTPVQTSPTANNLAAGTYSVVVSDASGCSATYTTSLSEPTALAATASVVANVSCAGGSDGSATSAASGGTAPYSFAWAPGAQNTQDASGLSAGPYTVTVTDANGCTTSQSVTITEPVAITLTQTIVQASCGLANGSADVSANGGTGPYTYLWLTVPVQTSQSVSGLTSGVYNVVVTDVFGCSQQMSITIPTSIYPIAEFTSDPDTVELTNAEVDFSNLSQNATEYLWDFGDPNDPSTSTEQDPIHVYTDTGVYCITLVANIANGVCADTVIHCIKVESPFSFYIPNSFTPNHDGVNEFFFGKGRQIKEYNIWVFDRWGNLIWDCHYSGSNDVWDAPFQDGMPAACVWDGAVMQGGADMSGNSKQYVQEDVYVWKVKLTDTHDKLHNYIGNLNVIR